MLVKYTKEIDILYIYFQSGTANILVPTDSDDIGKFVLKSNRAETVGYEVENASENMHTVLCSLGLTSKQRLAVVLSVIREQHNKTQKQYADLLNISESSYKNIERAEHNITFETMDAIFKNFPKEVSSEIIFKNVG